ncbi:MAG: hypothetical protein JNJ85_12160 [Candidatus Kapabacteria bacterium]|nr:hypothetical protein [Candidatus Kapabacteria bacterium]MBX7154209.1 hypothetical protein [Bacteroidota bacterium]
MIDEPLTPSELIYLYVDGEADSVQQTTLFAALATDPELQQEFNEALAMRKAFEHERASAQPPAYLTSKVYEDAGLITGTTVGAGIATLIWLWLRKASIPIGASIIGAVAMYFGLSLSQGTTNTASMQQSNQPTTTIEKVTPLTQPVQNNVAINSGNNQQKTRIVYVDRIQPIPVPAVVNESSENNIEATQEEVTPNFTVGDEPLDLHSASNYGEMLTNTRYNARRVSGPNFSYIAPSLKGIQTVGINGLGQYEFVQNQTSIANKNNFSLTYGYQVGDNVSVGVEGGKMAMNYSQYTRFGIYGNYRFDAVALGGQPYVQAVLGATDQGLNPFTNINFGMSFPIWYFRFNAGVESNLLFLSDKTHGTIGFTSGLSYSF